MARRHYSDEARAAALAVLDANGGNLTRAAREAGVPLSTLKHWQSDRDRAAPAELRSQKKVEAAEVYESIRDKASSLIDRALDLIPPETLAGDARMLTAVSTVGGTADDKATRTRGEPTEHLKVSSGLTPEEAVAIMRRRREAKGRV